MKIHIIENNEDSEYNNKAHLRLITNHCNDYRLCEDENEYNVDEDWIKEIESNVKANKRPHIANRKETKENKNIKNVIVEANFMKEIMKLRDFTEMRCSF